MSIHGKKIKVLVLSGSIIASSPAIAELQFDRTYFIGDSLSDTGQYKQLPGVQGTINTVNKGLAFVNLPTFDISEIGRFTTGGDMLWSEYLAQHNGTNASVNVDGSASANGDNYAFGGARVATDYKIPLNLPKIGNVANITVPSLKTQSERFLKENNYELDPDSLYTVWGGANDVFALDKINEGIQDSSVRRSNGVALLNEAAETEAEIVQAFKQAGAKYILVPTVPNIGLTPAYRKQGQEAMDEYSGYAKYYNDTVYANLKKLGIQFIPMDTYTLLGELHSNPEAYGIKNVTDPICPFSDQTGAALVCGKTIYKYLGAGEGTNKTYAYADSVHPSGATHNMLAQYAISILEAPLLQQSILRSAQTVGKLRADQVGDHISTTRPANGLSWWGNIRGHKQEYLNGRIDGGVNPGGLLGLDWANDGAVFGLFAGYDRTNINFGSSEAKSHFTQKDTSAGIFAGLYGDRAWINILANYSWLKQDVTRKVQLGEAVRTHSGSVNGHNITAAFNAGYEFGTEGVFRHGPVIGLTWQKTKLDGYTEDHYSATALGYPEQEIRSTVGRAGWKLRFDNGVVDPYLQVMYEHEFAKDTPAKAWLQTRPDAGIYEVPGVTVAKNSIKGVLGVRTQIQGLRVNVGVQGTFGLSQPKAQAAKNYAVFATLSSSF